MKNSNQSNTAAPNVGTAKLDVKSEINALSTMVQSRGDNLMSILTRAYKLYYAICKSDETEGKEYVDELNEFLDKPIKNSKSRALHTAIIRSVFDKSDMDRRQVSTYGKLLENAEKMGTNPVNFKAWVSNNGGITKASRLFQNEDGDSVISAADISNRIDAALADIDKISELAVVQSSDLASHISSDDFEFKLAFCKWDSATDELTIYRIIEDEKQVKAAFKPFEKDVTDEVAEIKDAELVSSYQGS